MNNPYVLAIIAIAALDLSAWKVPALVGPLIGLAVGVWFVVAFFRATERYTWPESEDPKGEGEEE